MTPFAKNSAATIGAWDENRLLRAVRRWLGGSAPAAPEGPGDDCAVFRACKPRALQLMTVDSVVYGRHFDDRATPEKAGAKLVKRNVSDIAAMGGKPTRAVAAVVCGKNVSRAWFARFCRGMAAAAQRWGVRLVGGDMSGAPDGVFSATLTLLGEAARPVLRTGAHAGDLLFVTGELGGSSAGWHLDFVPRLKEAQWLARSAAPSAMIDITDGLFKDLPAILPRDCDAVLDADRLPVRACARGKDALRRALGDGEDYELLFALSPKRVDIDRLRARWKRAFPRTRLSLIGEIARGGSGALRLRSGERLTGKGYSHF